MKNILLEMDASVYTYYAVCQFISQESSSTSNGQHDGISSTSEVTTEECAVSTVPKDFLKCLKEVNIYIYSFLLLFSSP